MNLTKLLQLRTVLKNAAQERGVSFSYMPIFIKVYVICDILFCCYLFICSAERVGLAMPGTEH